MYLDFEWLHLTNYKFTTNLPESTMNKLSELLIEFSLNIGEKCLFLFLYY